MFQLLFGALVQAYQILSLVAGMVVIFDRKPYGDAEVHGEKKNVPERQSSVAILKLF
jgi:hypothetical protein